MLPDTSNELIAVKEGDGDGSCPVSGDCGAVERHGATQVKFRGSVDSSCGFQKLRLNWPQRRSIRAAGLEFATALG